MKERIPFNDSWLYKPSFTSADPCGTTDTAEYSRVDLPHTNKILPYNCFDEAECQFISSYKKLFRVSKNWEGKTVLLEFEGVMAACDVWCNGIHVGGHEGGFTPFQVDLTKAVTDRILLDLPMAFLCREDCKGLCPVCGADLNEGDCGCQS